MMMMMMMMISMMMIKIVKRPMENPVLSNALEKGILQTDHADGL